MNNDTSSSPVSAGTLAGIRLLIISVGSFAVGRGWVEAGDLEAYATAALTIGVAVYGIWKTTRRQKQIKTAEHVLGGKIVP